MITHLSVLFNYITMEFLSALNNVSAVWSVYLLFEYLSRPWPSELRGMYFIFMHTIIYIKSKLLNIPVTEKLKFQYLRFLSGFL